MKGRNIVGLLIVAASVLSFSNSASAWDYDTEVTDWEEYTNGGGDGEYDPYADTTSFSWAYADAYIEDPESNTWSEALATIDYKVYIIDYDDEGRIIGGHFE